MWTCPKCGREFKRTNPGHYCGKAPGTAAEYIAAQPEEVRPHLMELRDILRRSVPDAHERILWSMPYYEKNGRSVSFAACKKHISFYVGVDIIEEFTADLSEFVVNKSAVYFPYDKVLPAKLIEQIAKRCLDQHSVTGYRKEHLK